MKDELFSNEPPEWAKDSFNWDGADQCGDCGAWCEIVRPGKSQCINEQCVQNN